MTTQLARLCRRAAQVEQCAGDQHLSVWRLAAGPGLPGLAGDGGLPHPPVTVVGGVVVEGESVGVRRALAVVEGVAAWMAGTWAAVRAQGRLGRAARCASRPS